MGKKKPLFSDGDDDYGVAVAGGRLNYFGKLLTLREGD